MGLSTPQHIIWQYFASLRRQVFNVCQTTDETILKQDAATCIILAVTVVEAFLNVLFRVVVSEQGFTQHEARLLKDIEGRPRRSLDYKVKHWPGEILGKGLDFDSPVPREFLALKERRNALMHYTSSHETIEVSGMTLQGLADSSVFDSLTADDALAALNIAEGVVAEIFKLRGWTANEIPHALHQWTGKVPI